MARPYPTCLTFMPTPLEVAKSSLIALIIFNVYCYHDTAFLHTIKTSILVSLIGPDSLISLNGIIGPAQLASRALSAALAPLALLALSANDGLFSLVSLIGLDPLASLALLASGRLFSLLSLIVLIVDPKDIPNIPNNQNVTYVKVGVAYRPPKENPYRIPITAGGNLINHPRDIMTQTATITTVKLTATATCSH
jgi:hypothetical protein